MADSSTLPSTTCCIVCQRVPFLTAIRLHGWFVVTVLVLVIYSCSVFPMLSLQQYEPDVNTELLSQTNTTTSIPTSFN